MLIDFSKQSKAKQVLHQGAADPTSGKLTIEQQGDNDVVDFVFEALETTLVAIVLFATNSAVTEVPKLAIRLPIPTTADAIPPTKPGSLGLFDREV